MRLQQRTFGVLMVIASLAAACSGPDLAFQEQSASPVITSSGRPGQLPGLTLTTPPAVPPTTPSVVVVASPTSEASAPVGSRPPVPVTSFLDNADSFKVAVAAAVSSVATDVATGEPQVLIIGDSVLRNLENAKTPFPFPVVFDTDVSRSVLKLPERLDALREVGPLPPYVVIHLGTNGWAAAFADVLEAELLKLSDRKVILINVYADRVWQDPANLAIAAAAQRNEHVSLIDWNARAIPPMLRADGVHPNASGRATLAALIREAVLASAPND